MKSGIYLIINIISHKEYGGKSKNLKKRRYRHFEDLGSGQHGNPHLQSAYDLYGRDAFVFVVVEYCEPEDLVTREKWWVDLLDLKNPQKGYNLLDPVAGPLGRTMTLETRQRMSISQTGRKHTTEAKEKMSLAKSGRKCRPFSSEHRANLSAARKGRSPSTECRANIAVALTGKPLSLEHKEKLSKAHTGKTLTAEHKASIAAGLRRRKGAEPCVEP